MRFCIRHLTEINQVHARLSQHVVKFVAGFLDLHMNYSPLLSNLSNSCSRSGFNPAFHSCSTERVFTQSIVSRTVSSSGRNVRPALIALDISVREKPASSSVSGTQTGISLHASTLFSVRNSTGAHLKFALLPLTPLLASSIAPRVNS